MKKRLLEIILKSLSIGILIYLIYKSEITWSGEQRFFYLKFFLVFLTINIIIFFYYKVSNATKKIIRTNLYTVLIIIYAFELFLNFILNNDNDIKHKADLLKKRGELFDERKKLEVYDSLIKDFPNAKLYVPPSNNLSLQNIEILPVSGVSNQKTIYCNENGYWFEFDSDRYGFNNPDEVWNKKQIEYLLLGDSYVMGACVNRPFDTASQIRKMSGKNVINLAMAGNGPLMQYVSLREYVFSNTKNVIWHYSEANDNFELALRLKNPILKKYLEYSRNKTLDSGIISGRDSGSPFQDAVAKELALRGFEIVQEVGVSGFFIDIGVKHKDYPHGYLAGVETDGATYHSSLSVRDNDIVRQKVLENFGWNIYRIWSTDWWKDPDLEMKKLVNYLHKIMNKSGYS